MGTHRLHQPSRLWVEDHVLTLLCTAAGPLLWWFGSTASAEPTGSGGLTVVEQSVAALCAGAGAVVAGWWLVALAGVALTACGHRWRSAGMVRLGGRLSPAFLRRVAASVLGVNLLLAPGAWADGGPHPGPSPSDTVAAPDTTVPSPRSAIPHPGWLPPTASSAAMPGTAQTVADRDPAPPSPAWTPRTPPPTVPAPTRANRPGAPEVATVAVRRGDCLWDIAAEELGPTATDLEVDRRWRQWYRHNRDLIGSEADLLLPGTVLTAPPFD